MGKGRLRKIKKTVRGVDYVIEWRDDGTWPKEGMRRPWDNAPACGAKTKRKGLPCLKIPSRGHRRCSNHGEGHMTSWLEVDPNAPATRSLAARESRRALGNVAVGDPRVLDTRATIAAMIGMTDLVRPLVVDSLGKAGEMVREMEASGLSVEGIQIEKLIAEIGTVEFDRAMDLINAYARIGALQGQTIRLQSLGQVVLDAILPHLEGFTSRTYAACRRLVPAENLAELNDAMREIALQTQASMVRDVELATKK